MYEHVLKTSAHKRILFNLMKTEGFSICVSFGNEIMSSDADSLSDADSNFDGIATAMLNSISLR